MVLKPCESAKILLMTAAVIIIATFEANSQQPRNPAGPTTAPSPVPSPRKSPDLSQPQISGKILDSLQCGPADYVPVDLSGTYRGTIEIEQGSVSGTGVLKIDNNQFTLTLGSSNVKGSVSATWKCGVTEVLFKTKNPFPPDYISNRATEFLTVAKKCDKGLKLESVGDEGLSVVFTESNASRKCDSWCPRRPCPKQERPRFLPDLLKP